MDNNVNTPVILLVDDNPQNLQVLGKFMHEEKFKTEFALNGQAALEWIKNKQFDMILLDLNMPGMNGFEVCSRIRSDPENSGIPIIFLSAESDRENILKGFEAGAQDYVTKPFDNRELLARVKTQIDLKLKTENLEKINSWLGKKIENWIKWSLTKSDPGKTNDLNERVMEFDKNQSLILKDITLELKTIISEVVKFFNKNSSIDTKNLCEDFISRMDNVLLKLEKL